MRIQQYKDDLYNFAVGFFMGSANVIPGVSGGTMLFIMGAFNRLTGALRDIAGMETLRLLTARRWRELFDRVQWRFLIGVGVGVLLSFATLAKVFVWLLKHHERPTFAFFLGLIAASIITVQKQMQRWTFGALISFVISAAAAFGIISLVPMDGGAQWYMLMLYGAICVIAMILPGLSGSFLLLIFGQYDRTWAAVGELAHFHFSVDRVRTVLFLGLGGIIGLGAFVHLLNFLMKRFYNATVAALIGFMVGALPRIWPWQHENPLTGRRIYDAPAWDNSLIWVIVCALAGLALVLAIEFCAGQKNRRAE